MNPSCDAGWTSREWKIIHGNAYVYDARMRFFDIADSKLLLGKKHMHKHHHHTKETGGTHHDNVTQRPHLTQRFFSPNNINMFKFVIVIHNRCVTSCRFLCKTKIVHTKTAVPSRPNILLIGTLHRLASTRASFLSIFIRVVRVARISAMANLAKFFHGCGREGSFNFFHVFTNGGNYGGRG